MLEELNKYDIKVNDIKIPEIKIDLDQNLNGIFIAFEARNYTKEYWEDLVKNGEVDIFGIENKNVMVSMLKILQKLEDHDKKNELMDINLKVKGVEIKGMENKQSIIKMLNLLQGVSSKEDLMDINLKVKLKGKSELQVKKENAHPDSFIFDLNIFPKAMRLF